MGFALIFNLKNPSPCSLSLGFIKNMEGKITLATLLFVGLPSILFFEYVPRSIAIPSILVLSVLMPFIISKGLFRPLSYVNEYLDKLNIVSINSIEQVSRLIIELINELTKEANNISSISQTIESLSAIATENSASSQEGAANIQNYTEQIKKMTENIHEFKKVSMSFSEDLEKYIV